MSNPVFYNPAVPFETLLDNVKPGLTVTVHGQRVHGDRIVFQFKTGTGPQADLAFRWVPRWITRPEVISNSRVGGKWGNEVTFVAGSTPIGNQGQTFQVMFVIENQQFKVAVNGSHFCTFPHRINLYNIKCFEVERAAALTQVSIYNPGNVAPSHPVGGPILNPAVPFETMLDNVKPGLTVTVHGQRVHGDRIIFQFKTGTGPQADLAFRWVPRWITRPEVISNSRVGGKWGNEITFVAGSTPIGNQGQTFQVMFVIENEQFKVAVNGSHFCTFPHRINLYNIKCFEVERAAILTQVSIYNPIYPEPCPSSYPAPYQPEYPTPYQPEYPTPYQPEYPTPYQPEYPTPYQPDYPAHFEKTAYPHHQAEYLAPPSYESVVSSIGNLTLSHPGNVAPPQPVSRPILNPANESPINIPLANIRDHSITICGVATRGRFSVQFLNSSNPPDIFFFFNPRLGQKIVARNSCYQNIWGAEETAISQAFPFQHGQPFQLDIAVDRQCFRISVNGMHLCDFHHRQRPLNQITRMKFSGMVKISSLNFH